MRENPEVELTDNETQALYLTVRGKDRAILLYRALEREREKDFGTRRVAGYSIPRAKLHGKCRGKVRYFFINLLPPSSPMHYFACGDLINLKVKYLP